MPNKTRRDEIELPNPADVIEQSPRGRYRYANRCKTCGGRWEEWIDRFFEAAIQMRSEYGLYQLHSLAADNGYPLTVGALRGHLIRHKPELWKRWNERDRDGTV